MMQNIEQMAEVLLFPDARFAEKLQNVLQKPCCERTRGVCILQKSSPLVGFISEAGIQIKSSRRR